MAKRLRIAEVAGRKPAQNPLGNVTFGERERKAAAKSTEWRQNWRVRRFIRLGVSKYGKIKTRSNRLKSALKTVCQNKRVETAGNIGVKSQQERRNRRATPF